MPGHGHEKSLENVSMERHGYSDSNPKIDLSDINFRYNESELIQVLGEFFYKEYREKLPDRHGRKRAFNKAESLIKGDFDKGNTFQISRRTRKSIKTSNIERIYLENRNKETIAP
ncbi:hypothetical protein GLU64_01475 [Nanohaloarchaea archaeon]|nr:hypothetical protein [Candidatus Nanohaloarchaea archaeon]